MQSRGGDHFDRHGHGGELVDESRVGLELLEDGNDLLEMATGSSDDGPSGLAQQSGGGFEWPPLGTLAGFAITGGFTTLAPI